MTKKIVIMALIPSLLIYLTGCYSMYDISKEDLKTSPNSKIRVMTINGDSYTFRDNSYYIQQDTLYGNIFDKNQTLIQKTIPLKDINALQTEKLNGGFTAMVAICSAVAIVLIGILIAVNSLE
jgi:hypothetical protein